MNTQAPPLTDRQAIRLNEWLREVNKIAEYRVHAYHLAWQVKDEIRPGRGHDVQAVYVDGDVFACLGMDPYGNGYESQGTVNVEHNSSDDECPCDGCAGFRNGDDQ